MNEYILCAAILFEGTIIAGHRHNDCYNVLRKLKGEFTTLPKEQGFLTSKNRFVDRSEAWFIAKENNQIMSYMLEDDEYHTLISEDLY